MLVPILLFLLGFGLLIKGGDWFVDGSVGIAHRFHLPELLIGATIVSIGTTLPEVMVSSQAAIEHNAGISYGNAIGSIICNTSLIAALTLSFRPGTVNSKTYILPSAFFFTAAVIYAANAYIFRRFDRWIGILFLVIFVVYIVWSTLQMKNHPELAEEESEEEEEGSKPKALWLEIVLLVLGILLVIKGLLALIDALKQKKIPVLSVVVPALTMAAGILVAFGNGLEIVLIIGGILLIVNGVIGLIEEFKA